MRYLVEALLVIMWSAGVVLAKGFWSTLAAIIIPPYSWYLLIKHVMTLAGWI